MGRMKKAARAGFTALGALLVLLGVTALVVPRFIDVARIRDRTTTQLSALVHGQVRSDALHVSLLPLPSAVLDQVSLSIPGTLDLKVASVSVYPKLLPLLRGKLRLAEVRIQSPAITFQRPAHAPATRDLAAGLEDTVTSALADISLVAISPAGGAAVVVNDGTAEIPAGSDGVAQLRHIDGRIDLPPERLGIDVHCTSNFWDRLSVKASLDPLAIAGTGDVEVVRLRPETIAAQFLPPGLRLGNSQINLALNVSAHGIHAVRVEVDGSIPAFTMQRGTTQVVLRSHRLGATLQIDGDVKQATLRTTQLDNPRMELSGSLSLTPDAATLDLQAADVDVDSVAQSAKLVAGDVPLVRSIFGIVRGGTVPHISVGSQAPSLGELGEDHALRIQGRLVGGRVHVPGADLDLDNVTGDATIAGSVLVGEQISARLAKSQATEGTLRVGLRGKAPALHVDTSVQADAAETATLLKRLVKDEACQREFERVSEVAGTASGRLSLDGTTDDLTVTAETSAFTVSGRVEGLRAPLRVEGGHFLYDTRGIEARDVALAVGGSRMSEVAFRILPGGARSFEAAAGVSEITLDEIYPWLQISGWLPESPWNPTSLTGTLSLDFLRLGRSPGSNWQFELTGSARKLVVESARLQQRIATQYAVSLSNLRVGHDPASGISFAAKVVAPDNLSGAVDVVWKGERLDIKELSVHDAHSDASLALSLGPRDLSLRFRGELTKATLDRLIDNDLLAESVRGDIRARAQRDQLARAAVQGRLEAHGVAVPLRNGRHLRIESVALDGAGDHVSGNAIVDTPEGIHMQVRGVVKQSPQALMADVDVDTGRIDWSAIEPWLSDADGVAGAAPSNVGSQQWRGKARVAAEAFSYGGFTWEPVRAVVALAPGGLTVTVSDATVCGIATPGTIAVTPQGLNLAFKPAAKNQPLQVLGSCLGLGNEPDTGQYNLDGEIAAHGAPAQLARSTQGRVQFHSAKGRLYGMGVTARVLSLLNVATNAARDISNLTKEGLPYDAIDVDGDVKNGVLVLREATLNGPTVNWAAEGSADVLARTLNVILLVAPLTTLDTVVSRLPVISGILGGSIITIPVRVSGSFDAPDITPLPPAAVGKGLLGVMTRMVKLPMKVIQPLLSDEAKPEPRE